MDQPRGTSSPAILIESLTKDYGETRAVDGLSLAVQPGEVVGFLGPNGAGKSTTIRILLDLIRPTAGRAEILGHDCQEDGVAARQAMGYLPGDLRLYESWTGREVAEFIANLRKMGVADSEIGDLARRLDLDLSRKVRAYSKGNRQKLGLLLALAHRPPVVVLDEPTAGLDPIRQRAVWKLLRERADAGAAVLFSSHVMSEVEAVCDRVAILRRGRLLTFGRVSELLAGAPARLELAFDGEAPDLRTVAGVHALAADGTAVSLQFDGDPNDLIQALAKHDLIEVRVHPARLDDVVFDFYEREEAA